VKHVLSVIEDRPTKLAGLWVCSRRWGWKGKWNINRMPSHFKTRPPFAVQIKVVIGVCYCVGTEQTCSEWVEHGDSYHNLSTWEAEAGGSRVSGQPGLYSETLSQTSHKPTNQPTRPVWGFILFAKTGRK
jgi:hypothetical protein